MPQSFHRFARFAVVGGVGFCVDAAVLLLIVELGGGPYVGRIISFAVAVSVTWVLNRGWAFAEDKAGGVLSDRRALPYIAVQLAGMLINYVIYYACLSVLGYSEIELLIALAVGSGVAMVFNYLLLKNYIFSARNDT